MARCLAAIVAAGLACGIVLASANAQGQDEVDRLLADVERLYGEGKSTEAVPVAERAVAAARERYGEEHREFSSAIGLLAVVYQAQGRYAEAELLLKRSLDIREKALGPEHINIGAALNNLAVLYREQRRYAEAEPLLRRALAIAEKERGPEHPSVSIALNQLAAVLKEQRRYADAEHLYMRNLDVQEKALGPEHRSVGKVLVGLAELYLDWNRHADAEPLFTRSLAVFEKALPPDHPDVASIFVSLARLRWAQARPTEAEGLLTRGLGIYEKVLGPEHPFVGTLLNNLAMLAQSQRDWARAADYMRRSTSIIKRRAARGLAGGRREGSGGEAQRLGWRFRGLVKMTYRASAHRLGPAATPSTQTFETAQWVFASEAAASFAQMAARSAKGPPRLAGLVRERQDLAGEWQLKDKLLIAAKSEEPAKRKADSEKVLADRLAAIDTRLVEIDRTLAQEFPDYAALVDPAPVSIAEVQAQLGTDEALVLFLDTAEARPLPEETFIWVVTKSEVRWVRSDLGTAALTREVAALRCGLDTTAWDGGPGTCAKALGIASDKLPRSYHPLPFDHARAYKLYLALFGEVQDVIKGKHLLIVPSGPLTQLPFQVLVTRPPASGDHRAAAWLAREHAVTVLPAVSSLKALRRVGRPSPASRPMIGFGNPLLDGPDASYEKLARLARDKQLCPEAQRQRIAALDEQRRGVARVETRGGLANLSQIKQQIPLPETADELCDVAQDVKADVARDIRLGMQATEGEIKRLSASGDLAKYRMVHFATHAVLSGQLDGTYEPGLILTPPAKATEEDDGYLSASEVAALKLDADWVILSACNTAAGAARSAEALSGLARAFIYAQARSLLVSHWEVYSDATVKLITAAVRDMAGDPKVGRAEALRRSMLALLDSGTAEEAHPAFWAPFVVVGEGAAER
jgi:CHAT domain-containing protein/tetratricopeptide (TPR) repeat protein